MVEITEIVVDDDVPITTRYPRRVTKRRPRRNPTIAYVVEKFYQMTPGQSFFIAGATTRDMSSIYRALQADGIGFVSRTMESDPIYQEAGVRVWRQHGEADEL